MTLSDHGVIMNLSNLKTTLLWNEKCGKLLLSTINKFLQLTKKVNGVNLFQKSD